MRFTLSERYVVALNFLLIAGCAYFAARAVNDTVASTLDCHPPSPKRGRRAARSDSTARAMFTMLIVDRDIFNAVKQQAAPPPAPRQPAAHRPASQAGRRLAGLTWTKPFAILEDQNSHDQAVYQLGNQIPDAGELTAVQKTKVVINHNGTLVTLEMQTDQPDQSAGCAAGPGADNGTRCRRRCLGFKPRCAPGRSQRVHDYARRGRSEPAEHGTALHPDAGDTQHGKRQDRRVPHFRSRAGFAVLSRWACAMAMSSRRSAARTLTIRPRR